VTVRNQDHHRVAAIRASLDELSELSLAAAALAFKGRKMVRVQGNSVD
jgi:hypothetical protein